MAAVPVSSHPPHPPRPRRSSKPSPLSRPPLPAQPPQPARPSQPAPLPRHALPPARWLAAAADQLATPMLLLEADGRLVHANRAAREWLAAQPRYRLDADGVLAPVDGRACRAWRRLLADSAQAAAVRAVPQLPGWRLHRLQGDSAAAPPRLVLLRPLPEGE